LVDERLEELSKGIKEFESTSGEDEDKDDSSDSGL
jgi:hypothetical protein